MQTAAGNKVETFFKAYPLRKYPKGQIIIYAREGTDLVYYLTKGKVKTYDISYRGDEVILNLYKPPAFFPMSIALNHADNTYFYETEEDSEVRCAPATEVVAFLEANPDVTFDLLRRLYRGLDGLMGRISHLMAGSAHSRILYELLLEARRFGTERPDGGYTLGLSEKDLGARAGLSRETVNRELHKLKEQGLITVGRNDMVIPDLARIAAKAADTL